MALAFAMPAFVVPAIAQDNGSVSDYRLPDPNQTPRPRPQGPSDPDNPFSVPAATPRADSTGSSTPVPAPSPAPRISIPPPPPIANTNPARTGATPRAVPPAQDTEATPPSEDAQITPTVAASTPAQSRGALPVPMPEAPSPPASTSALPEAAPATESQSNDTWWVVGAVALLALAAGTFFLVRRRRPVATEAFEEPATAIAPEPIPDRAPRSVPVPRPAPVTPAPTIPAAPLLQAAPFAEPLVLATAFAAKAVRLSLVYATLQYELEVANAGTTTLGPMHIRADLASAHASIPTRDQLAPAPDRLEVKHALPELAAGETVMLAGEIRVPLTQIQPLVKGNAHFFVPLARFCFIAPDGTAVRRVFTVGPIDTNGGSGLASVRLDAGPRNLRFLGVREIEAARGFSLDPAITHS